LNLILIRWNAFTSWHTSSVARFGEGVKRETISN
jgi:hypothetical protein